MLAGAIGAALLAGAGAGAASAADQPWTLHKAVGAPAALTLTGSTRVRYEIIGGQVRPGFGDGEDLVAMRSQLFAEYKTGPLRLGAELYDSRAYGVDRLSVLSTSDVNALEPVQVYAALDLKDPFGNGGRASVQAGRMALNIGSRRLVASDDYRNTLSSYTGLKVETATGGGYGLTAIYVAPQTKLPEDVASLRKNKVVLDDESEDLVLWGALATKSAVVGKALVGLEYFGLDERDGPGRPTRNRNLHTFGAWLFQAPAAGKLDFDVEVLRQTGTVRASTSPTAALSEVSAGFVHAEVGYQFPDAWKSHLSLEYDMASGDRGAGRYNRFDSLFGMRRADLAPSGIYSAISRTNIETGGARLEVTPSARLDGFVHANLFWLDSATDSFSSTGVRDAGGRSGRYGGEQIEGRIRYWLVPRALRFEANAVLLRKGRFLKTAPNAPATAGTTAYVSAAVTASF